MFCIEKTLPALNIPTLSGVPIRLYLRLGTDLYRSRERVFDGYAHGIVRLRQESFSSTLVDKPFYSLLMFGPRNVESRSSAALYSAARSERMYYYW